MSEEKISKTNLLELIAKLSDTVDGMVIWLQSIEERIGKMEANNPNKLYGKNG